MSGIPHFHAEEIAALESISTPQLRALSRFLMVFGQQAAAKELVIRPNVFCTKGDHGDDEDVREAWHEIIHFVNLPESVPHTDMYDDPRNLVKADYLVGVHR
jgi:hypothetical protein